MRKLLFIFAFIALLSGCSEEPGDLQQYYFFTDPDNFVLTLNKDSIAADDRDYAEITVKVSDTVMQRYAEIKLEASPEGNFANDSSGISVPINGDGVAIIRVFSVNEGRTIITARIGVISRIAEVEFYRIFKDSLSLFVTSRDVPADNYTYAEIVAITNSRGDTGNQLVFTSDNGLFSNNSNTLSVQVSSSDTTKVYIRNNTPGQARVGSILNNSFTEEIVVNFTTSWPDQLIIDPDSSSLKPSFYAMTNVVAQSIKFNGTVTAGQVVNFYDSTATGQPVGSFLNTTLSNSNGEAMTEYWVQDTSYHGFVYIKGVINTDKGAVSGIGKIYIR